MSLDKTPFLVLEEINEGWYNEKGILSNGKIQTWFESQLNRFSEVIDEAR